MTTRRSFLSSLAATALLGLGIRLPSLAKAIISEREPERWIHITEFWNNTRREIWVDGKLFSRGTNIYGMPPVVTIEMPDNWTQP